MVAFLDAVYMDGGLISLSGKNVGTVISQPVARSRRGFEDCWSGPRVCINGNFEDSRIFDGRNIGTRRVVRIGRSELDRSQHKLGKHFARFRQGPLARSVAIQFKQRL